jgi:copper chaperone CopZ
MIPGVTEVEVSLADDSVTDTADQPVDKRAVRAAVDEAGASAGVGQRPGPLSSPT